MNSCPAFRLENIVVKCFTLSFKNFLGVVENSWFILVDKLRISVGKNKIAYRYGVILKQKTIYNFKTLSNTININIILQPFIKKIYFNKRQKKNFYIMV